MATHPSGEQYEITADEHRAVVTEVGGTLRTYEVGGREVVRGFGVEEVVRGGRGQQLLPWPNRIRDGRYPFAGKEQQLALSEPARHNASHGLVRWVPWDLQEHTPDSVTQRVRVFPQPGWPGAIEARLTHTVGPSGLTVDLHVRNIGATAVPFGYAAHPYLSVGETVVDDVSLSVPADTYLEVDERLLPTALHPVDGSPYDLRSGTPIGDRNLDTALTGLTRAGDDRWRVRAERGDRWAELWAGPGLDWVQIFTGGPYRDISIAVEPMTCGPNAFNPGPTHDGMITLEAGAAFSCSWGVRGG
ncbi:MAG: aldose 1-epimerase family protein [Actinomycetes bacterium]